MAQIEDQLPGALFFKLGDLGPDVLYPARRERHRLDHTNRLGALVGHQPRAYGREYERSADQCEFLRLGPPDAQHAHLNRGSVFALEQDFREGQRHIASRDVVDGLDHVAGREAGLGRGRAWECVHHAHIAEALREHQADIRLGRFLGLEVLLVLIGIKIAGVRIQGFEHPVDRPERDCLHVRLFHVVGPNPGKNLAINAEVSIGVVRRCAPAMDRAE